jgi:hypothetical protein
MLAEMASVEAPTRVLVTLESLLLLCPSPISASMKILGQWVWEGEQKAK